MKKSQTSSNVGLILIEIACTNISQRHFTRKMSRISRDSSEALDDDRVSLASSDASSSHRLNDVGDVQNLARLQEESKSRFCYFTKYLFK